MDGWTDGWDGSAVVASAVRRSARTRCQASPFLRPLTRKRTRADGRPPARLSRRRCDRQDPAAPRVLEFRAPNVAGASGWRGPRASGGTDRRFDRAERSRALPPPHLPVKLFLLAAPRPELGARQRQGGRTKTKPCPSIRSGRRRSRHLSPPLPLVLCRAGDHSFTSTSSMPAAARCGPWPDLPAQGVAWRLIAQRQLAGGVLRRAGFELACDGKG